MKAATLALGWLEQRPKDLIEECWSLADDEHTDDHDDTEGDVVVLATASMTLTLNVDVRRRRLHPDCQSTSDVVDFILTVSRRPTSSTSS